MKKEKQRVGRPRKAMGPNKKNRKCSESTLHIKVQTLLGSKVPVVVLQKIRLSDYQKPTVDNLQSKNGISDLNKYNIIENEKKKVRKNKSNHKSIKQQYEIDEGKPVLHKNKIKAEKEGQVCSKNNAKSSSESILAKNSSDNSMEESKTNVINCKNIPPYESNAEGLHKNNKVKYEATGNVKSKTDDLVSKSTVKHTITNGDHLIEKTTVTQPNITVDNLHNVVLHNDTNDIKKLQFEK